MNDKTVKDVFAGYDDVEKKHFDFYQINSNLLQLSQEVQNSKECEYESIAMSLVPNASNNSWETYYGPCAKGEDKEGNLVEYPTFQSITIDAVNYWYDRAKQVENPYLKVRYLGLVWDFMKKVSEQKYPSDLFVLYIESLLKVVEEEYPSHPVITVNICNRLFDLTKGNSTYLPQVKLVLENFDKKYSADEYEKSPRLWGMYLQLMIAYGKKFEQSEISVVLQRHEERLNNLRQKVENDKSIFWTLKEQVTLLAEYYYKNKLTKDTSRVLHVLEDAYKIASSEMTGMQCYGNLEMIARMYAKYDLLVERNRILAEIEKSGADTVKELVAQKFEFTYPQEALKQLESYILQGSIQEQIQRFCLYFVPSKVSQEELLKKLSNEYPLQYLIPKQLLNEKGKPLSVIGGIDEDFDGQLVLQLTQMLQFQSIPLNHIIQTLITNGVLNISILKQLATNTPIVPGNRLSVIEKALNCYFNGDYLIFCHLIIPQIETMIREFLEFCGRETIRPQANKRGYTMRILDDMLRDEAIVQVFNSNTTYYMRVVLTDQRGLNIRNALCHGLIPPSSFGQMAADRLLHIFLLWLQIRKES